MKITFTTHLKIFLFGFFSFFSTLYSSSDLESLQRIRAKIENEENLTSHDGHKVRVLIQKITDHIKNHEQDEKNEKKAEQNISENIENCTNLMIERLSELKKTQDQLTPHIQRTARTVFASCSSTPISIRHSTYFFPKGETPTRNRNTCENLLRWWSGKRSVRSDKEKTEDHHVSQSDTDVIVRLRKKDHKVHAKQLHHRLGKPSRIDRKKFRKDSIKAQRMRALNFMIKNFGNYSAVTKIILNKNISRIAFA